MRVAVSNEQHRHGGRFGGVALTVVVSGEDVLRVKAVVGSVFVCVGSRDSA